MKTTITYTPMTRVNKILIVCCLLAFVGGIVIGYNYSVGYETVDFVKYLMDKGCTLLQSFAFVILVIAIMLRNALVTLLNQVSKNVDVFVEKLAERGFKQQETYKSQDMDMGKLGGRKL
ncbi:MAG: hypothetical protein ACLRFK_03185 [Alphaproteobacteria bacterium]